MVRFSSSVALAWKIVEDGTLVMEVDLNSTDIPRYQGPAFKDAMRKFRFARRKPDAGHSAIMVKINKKALAMEIDEKYDSITLEELVEELPENNPRYVVLSYEIKHPDGRVQSPLVLISWAPTSAEMGLLTLHASALQDFQHTVDVGKLIEIREDPGDVLTKEYLDSTLGSKY